MEHVGIDLGGKQSQVCVRNSAGEIIEERKVATRALKGFLQHRERSRVVMETCSESLAVSAWAREFGHEVRVVSTTLVRSLGVGARGLKTDRRDAAVLSEVSCRIDLPSVHCPSAKSRALRTLCSTRDALIESRTSLINTVRGWLRVQLVSIPTGQGSTFAQRVRAAISAEHLPTYIERQLRTIEFLSDQIREATKEIAEEAKTNPTCQRLTTIPGVGPLTSVRFVATVDNVARFKSANALQSYLGLTPGENSSSDRIRRTSITKAGPTSMRWTLIQAAWSARRLRDPDPMITWSLEIERRRGVRIAVVALARKLAGVMFAVWRDGTNYQPARSTRPMN